MLLILGRRAASVQCSATANAGEAVLFRELVEIEVEQEHVDPGLSEKT
jgi:hypothetical protein